MLYRLRERYRLGPWKIMKANLMPSKLIRLFNVETKVRANDVGKILLVACGLPKLTLLSTTAMLEQNRWWTTKTSIGCQQ